MDLGLVPLSHPGAEGETETETEHYPPPSFLSLYLSISKKIGTEGQTERKRVVESVLAVPVFVPPWPGPSEQALQHPPTAGGPQCPQRVSRWPWRGSRQGLRRALVAPPPPKGRDRAQERLQGRRTRAKARSGTRLGRGLLLGLLEGAPWLLDSGLGLQGAARVGRRPGEHPPPYGVWVRFC